MKFGEFDKDDVRFNNIARSVVSHGLKLVPGAGEVLAGVIVHLWPEMDDVWDSIRQRTEKLIEAKINDNDFRRLSEMLRDLKSSFEDYLKVTNLASRGEMSKDEVKTHWITVAESLRSRVSSFMGTDHDQTQQTLMLPLFSRFSLLYFSHLREAIEYGADYGMSGGLLKKCKDDYKQKQKDFKAHIDKLYNAFVTQTKQRSDKEKNNKWEEIYPYNAGRIWFTDGEKRWNDFAKTHNFFVLQGYNYVDLWEYLRPGSELKYPVMSHEIYSPACGAFGTIPMEDHAGNFGSAKQKKKAYQLPDLPRPAPKARVSKVKIWYGSWIDAIEVVYADGSSSGRMGGKAGGGLVELDATKPITRVKARGAVSCEEWMPKSYVYGIELDQGADSTKYCDRERAKPKNHYPMDVDFSHEGMCLSSVFGRETKDYSHACFVFGFRYVNGYGDQIDQPPELSALKVLYCAVADPEAFLSNVEKHWGMRKTVEKAIADDHWNEARSKKAWLATASTPA